jgi:transcriptional regulator with XRE-family HTH domain
LANIAIANKIKRLRQNKNITLKTLAEETGLTVGYLSRIENSKTVPPIPTLHKIARGLEVDPTYFFLEEKEAGPGEPDQNFLLVKNSELSEGNFSVHYKRGYQFKGLATGMKTRNMHPYLIVGEHEFGEVQQHEGEEFMYVLEGTLEFLHGSSKYVLEKGDCAYFNANMPHCGRSIGEGKAHVLTVIYDYKPNTRRV